MTTIKHQTSFEINHSAEELFPLFSAEGEKLWIPGWDYENIMGSTDLHEDYVFFTSGHIDQLTTGQTIIRQTNNMVGQKI